VKPKTCILYSAILLLLVSAVFGQDQGGREGVNWPSFRGHHADGISDGFAAPVKWDLGKSQNIAWKAAIPGLGHSSPVIWGDRVFVTTAISGLNTPELKVGLYGSIDPVEDDTVHQWQLICLDKSSGKVLWKQTSYQGVPKVKRHPKSTHANSTPATDGKHVVAFFGSEGLYCYDMAGNLIWKTDFGVLNSTYYVVPSAQWGFASSPVIHSGSVIVQCDVLENSFLAALDIKTGKELWRTARDEVPTWGTPTIYPDGENTQIIVNGYKHIGAYDFKTGKEIWKIVGGGDIPVPTPVVADDLVFINSAHGKMSPIYAIKLNSKGDISLKPGDTSNEQIVWSIKRGGAYMQTPIVYGDYLYNLRGNGSLSCFRAKTGELIYREAVGKMASFSASGVAADGKLYFPSEQGEVYVVKAGPEFEVLGSNPMNDICMATPALSEGTLFVRTHHYLVAVANK